MDRKASILVAAGTLCAALGIGAVMQYGPWSGSPQRVEGPLTFSDVQEVSSSPRVEIPQDRPMTEPLPGSVVSNAFTPEEDAPIELPTAPAETGFDCEIDMTATPVAGAMMSVTLNAPCHGSERVTLHHNGLMFTEMMQPDGSLTLEVPALAEDALVIASFLDGAGALAHATVTSVPFYDRVAIQWRGDAGLQLHAREFDAQYFSEGHVWQGAAEDPAHAATGEGGFLTRLGTADAPGALLAEVYTFPSGMTDTSGTVALTVEAEILATNCEQVVEAQTLELRNGKPLVSKELTVDIPGCDAVGDFLMLKNIVEDLTIAAN